MPRFNNPNPSADWSANVEAAVRFHEQFGPTVRCPETGRVYFGDGAFREGDGMSQVREPVETGEWRDVRVTKMHIVRYWKLRLQRAERDLARATHGDRDLGKRPTPELVPAAEAEVEACRVKLAEAEAALNPLTV